MAVSGRWSIAITQRVGMTLLKIDEGVDTGPVYLQSTCEIDEVRESHTIIQYRVVLENLDAIGRTLRAIGEGQPVITDRNHGPPLGHVGPAQTL